MSHLGEADARCQKGADMPHLGEAGVRCRKGADNAEELAKKRNLPVCHLSSKCWTELAHSTSSVHKRGSAAAGPP